MHHELIWGKSVSELPVGRRKVAEFRVRADGPRPVVLQLIQCRLNGLGRCVHDIDDGRTHRDESFQGNRKWCIREVETDKSAIPAVESGADTQPDR